jgi:hypothetical protein
MRLFIESCSSIFQVEINEFESIDNLKQLICDESGIPNKYQRLICRGKQFKDKNTIIDIMSTDDCTIRELLSLHGGINFQNRAGSNTGGGGGVASEANIFLDLRCLGLFAKNEDFAEFCACPVSPKHHNSPSHQSAMSD